MRRVLVQLHLWTGLLAGLWIVALGLSGSALVFRADLERWQAASLLIVEPAGSRLRYDDLIAIALDAHPERVLTRFRPPHAPQDALEVVLQNPGARDLKSADLLSVFVDPYSGRVLGTIPRGTGLIWWLQDFHYALFAGIPGLRINGIAALLLVVLAFTGPLLWWPGRRHLRHGFKIRWRAAPVRWVRDLHALAGLAGAALLVFVATTAVYFAFRQPATRLITAMTGDAPLRPPAVAPPADPTATMVSLDKLVGAATAAVPDATLDEVRPSRRADVPASVAFRRAGEFAAGRNRLYLDPVTGAVLRIDVHHELATGQRLFGSMAPWHFGSFGGRWTQVLWFVLGLVPALLFGSGVWVWWRKRRRMPAVSVAASGA